MADPRVYRARKLRLNQSSRKTQTVSGPGRGRPPSTRGCRRRGCKRQSCFVRGRTRPKRRSSDGRSRAGDSPKVARPTFREVIGLIPSDLIWLRARNPHEQSLGVEALAFEGELNVDQVERFNAGCHFPTLNRSIRSPTHFFNDRLS